jgi:class 3 adenylate cyclase/tetratricopeptide (TPR) repeat protein
MAVAERIIEGLGGAAPHDVARPVRGKTPERKVLTTLFVDIVSSSALVAGRDPEDADQILLSILNSLIEAVPRYDGMVSQLLGDGFMAVFGAPNAQEDHALRACLAAQDMVRATVEAADLPDFQVRIGISSGDVVAHVVESGVWADYRTVGECVHLAAKLQQRADPNSAQLSLDTLDLAPVGVAVRPVGSLILAKGAVPMPAFALEGARAVRRTATDLLRATNAPFIGRDSEMATINQLAAQAEAGQAAALILRGEAGIGKSRLVGEFLRNSRNRRWTVLLWSQMPVRRLGDLDDLEAVAQNLAVQVAESANDDGAQRVVAAAERRVGSQAADAVRELLGFDALTPLWNGLDPSQRLTLAIEGLVGALLDLSARHPMLVLVEDAHWARPVMIRLLNALTAALTGQTARLLVIVTMRPPALRLESTVEGWAPAKSIRCLDLKTLSRQQGEQFLNHWLGPDWSLTDLKTQVADRSQGVPLYLEEILRALESTKAIAGTPGAFRLIDPLAAQNLPRSLHGLLAARMDLLDQHHRQVLLNAAVIGPTFDIGLLNALASPQGDGLEKSLSYLERAGFILRTRLLPNLEYAFHHTMIQETAYATLTKAARKALHANVFRALRKRRVADLPNRIDLLAHHSFRAESWSAAYVCGRRAGRKAESRSKLEDATRHYRNALSALNALGKSRRNIPRRIDLLIDLPRTLLPRGGTDVHDHLNQARALAEESDDSMRLAQANATLVSFLWAYGELEDAIAVCQQGLQALEVRDHQQIRIQLLFRLGGVLSDQGYFAQALTTLSAGDALLRGNLEVGNYGMATFAAVHPPSVSARSLAGLGRRAEALSAGAHAVDIAEESRHVFSQIYANAHLGWACLVLGDVEQAIPPLRKALSLSEAARAPILRPLITGGLGYASVLTGEHSTGFQLFEESFASFQRQGNVRNPYHPRVFLPQVLLWQAQALAHAGKHNHALAVAQDVIDVAIKTGQLSYEAYGNLFIANAAHPNTRNWSDRMTRIHRVQTIARTLAIPGLLDACEDFAPTLLSGRA